MARYKPGQGDLKGIVAVIAHPVVNRRRRKKGAVRFRYESEGEVSIVEIRPGDSIQSYLKIMHYGPHIDDDEVRCVFTLLPPEKP